MVNNVTTLIFKSLRTCFDYDHEQNLKEMPSKIPYSIVEKFGLELSLFLKIRCSMKDNEFTYSD